MWHYNYITQKKEFITLNLLLTPLRSLSLGIISNVHPAVIDQRVLKV